MTKDGAELWIAVLMDVRNETERFLEYSREYDYQKARGTLDSFVQDNFDEARESLAERLCRNG